MPTLVTYMLVKPRIFWQLPFVKPLGLGILSVTERSKGVKNYRTRGTYNWLGSFCPLPSGFCLRSLLVSAIARLSRQFYLYRPLP